MFQKFCVQRSQTNAQKFLAFSRISASIRKRSFHQGTRTKEPPYILESGNFWPLFEYTGRVIPSGHKGKPET